MTEFHGMAGHLIRRLNQISTSVFQDHMKTHGLDVTPVQFAALDTLAHNPGITQAIVAETIAYDRATIGGVIDRLVAKGLVERKVSDEDRRARVLTLTETGRETLRRLHPIVRSLQSDILGGLSKDEQQQFLDLAQKAATRFGQA